jgi:hypothetical protein
MCRFSECGDQHRDTVGPTRISIPSGTAHLAILIQLHSIYQPLRSSVVTPELLLIRLKITLRRRGLISSRQDGYRHWS